MIAEADKDGDGMVSLQEFINVMNSAHSENKDVTETYPRILTEGENPNSSIFTGQSCSSAASSDEEFDTDDDKAQLHLSDKAEVSGIPNIPNSKPNQRKRKRSIIDWIKGPPKESDLKLLETEISNDAVSSSSSSVTSDTGSAIPNRLKQRRRSSITQTLRNGKDVFLATAKTIRKLSG